MTQQAGTQALLNSRRVEIPGKSHMHAHTHTNGHVPLRSCQIHERDFATSHALRLEVGGLNGDGNIQVGARGLAVHLCMCVCVCVCCVCARSVNCADTWSTFAAHETQDSTSTYLHT
jgi:hypothetical protein